MLPMAFVVWNLEHSSIIFYLFLPIEVVKTCCQFNPKPKTQARDLLEAANICSDGRIKTITIPTPQLVVEGEKKQNLMNFWLGTSDPSQDSYVEGSLM